MYIYWRIQQDLTCLGEIIQFKDPVFINAIRKWVKKNFTGIMLAEEISSGRCFFKIENKKVYH